MFKLGHSLRTLAVLVLVATPGSGDTTQQHDLTVQTKQGTYQGSVVDDSRQWLGIRYAVPPIQDLRFAPTQTPADFEGVRNATHFGSPCLQAQTAYDVYRGDEDCLFLNIYTPGNSTASSNLPVMVWIHGGGFINGAGNDFVSTNLSRTANAVVVTINYRLGPFGWLALDSLSEEQNGVSGNYGLMDQLAAFQWIQDNIAGFGGDPTLTTIFGQSAGGESVLAHVAAAPSGLFQRAISHSAPASLNLPTLRNVSQRNQDVYAISTGCGNFTGSSQVQCLRNLPSEYALSQANETWNLLEAGGLYWTPIIQVPTLPDQWINMYRDGKFNRVPIIVGHTAEEGRLFTAIYENSAGRPISDQDMNQIVATAGGALGSAVVETIYPSSNYGDPANRTASIVTDGQFVAGLTRVRNAISQASNAPAVWAYQFRDPDAYNVNVVGKYQNIMDGHDSELPFLFQYNPGQVPPHNPPFTTDGLLLAIQMGQYWGNFARTGNPNAASLPKWPQWIDISDSTPVMSFQPFNGGAQALANGTYYSAHQEAFWDPIIEASLAAANIANNI